MIYLDSSSTAKYTNFDDLIVYVMTDAMRDSWQNPSSLYATNIKDKINKCRANLAQFIGAKPDEIYYTSGASESNNWAIRGWDDEIWLNTYKKSNIITTGIEHNSILRILEDGNLGSTVHYCDVDEVGIVDMESLEDMLIRFKNKNEPTLISIGMANNEIGTIQDIKAISNLAHKYNAVIHVDATQALPYIRINVKDLDIDMMSASGHKISPVLKGVGFLYKKKSISIQPLIYGSQQDGLRGGTENTFGIIGINKAIEYCDVSDKNVENMCRKRDYFISLLESKFGCQLNGHEKFRLPNNINVTFPQNIIGESLLYTLDISDIKISTGSACNSRSIEQSHVLKEIGLDNDSSMRTVRFTLSNDTTYKDIDTVVDEINKIIRIMEIT